MSSGMICTNCFQPTYVDPDFGNLPAEAVIEICENWMCVDCLDIAAQEEAVAPDEGAGE